MLGRIYDSQGGPKVDPRQGGPSLREGFSSFITEENLSPGWTLAPRGILFVYY
jgi:hypothetical protein